MIVPWLLRQHTTECCDVVGLKTGEVNKPQTFTIETRGAGQGGVGLSVVGPTEPKIGCVDNHDGTLTVEYLPNSVGNYEIAVSFADQPVPGLHTSLHCSIRPSLHAALVEMRLYWEFPWVPWVPWDSHGNGNR